MPRLDRLQWCESTSRELCAGAIGAGLYGPKVYLWAAAGLLVLSWILWGAIVARRGAI